MTIAIGQNQERGLFDLVDDWLKKDRFVFVGWSSTRSNKPRSWFCPIAMVIIFNP